MLFFLNHIPELIYASKTKRYFNAFFFKNIWDFVIFWLFLTFIIISYKRYPDDEWEQNQLITAPSIKAEYYARRVLKSPTKTFENGLLVFMVMSLWIRAFYMLRYNEYFGKLTGIVQRILPDIVVFFFFYLIQLFFFAVIAQQAFRRLDQFNTFEKAYSTLFFASFGFFNFAIFEENDTHFG